VLLELLLLVLLLREALACGCCWHSQRHAQHNT
jgi:hypothetical protein